VRITPLSASLAIVGAYLIGSIPWGVLIGRAHGVDIRRVGSGNIGATNVGRALGRKWGLVCLVLDIAKGLVPTLLIAVLTPGPAQAWPQLALRAAVGLAAIVGHVSSVFLGFRGGKAVATTIGVGLGTWPYLTWPTLLGVVCYGLVRGLTRYVSAGSLVLAVSLPVWFWAVSRWFGWPLARHWPMLALTVAAAVIIVVRHRENIRRLVRGEELPVAPGESAGSRAGG